ncbi:MAG: protein translocase subunit SecF [Fidelibacterota bacterium]
MRLLRETNIHFIGQSRFAFFLSGTIILAGLISLFLQGGPRLSVDFKGGTLVAVQFTEDMDVDNVRNAMGHVSVDGLIHDFSKAEIKRFGTSRDISVRLPLIDDQPENFPQLIVDHLYESFPALVPSDVNHFILSIEKVGPKIGAELSGKAVMAIVSALILILIYISIRFEFKFAVSAIGALTHDVIITLGIFSIMDYEISLPIIAAFLTIVGYSLNDTIVIFDRIRENVKMLKRVSYSDIVDRSLNDSLSRTVITSLTTFLVVFILFIFGGEVIHYFAFAMLIGVIVGTYSSIYIASPLVVQLHKKN